MIIMNENNKYLISKSNVETIWYVSFFDEWLPHELSEEKNDRTAFNLSTF